MAGGLTPERLNEVTAALDAARAAGLRTDRERDYVEAVRAFLRDHASTPHAQRLQAFDTAMAQVAARYPDDIEAAILSALITSANFDPADKTYANQLKAAGILEPLYKNIPNHPGIAHYLIHSYDYPAIASKGLDAAKAYARIAPDAAHALHMPSHIFTRVGYWKESIAANRESARVAGDATFDGHHASDYLVYAHLQLAQDEAARQAMQQSYRMKPVDNFGASFAYAAMPARFALERGDWAAAANLALTPRRMPIRGRSIRRPRRPTPSPAASAPRGPATRPARASNRPASSPCAMRRRRRSSPTGWGRSTSRRRSSARSPSVPKGSRPTASTG